ncbi:MAG: NTP transferase domain-containing protein [Ignavibacteriae bacterium]|nr:NTP transferase domain-containing protein [Ignavibacteriota bacterium]
MKAVIMAGGFGTRLRPLTCNIPKPMVPMLNRPMMHHIVELLKRHGFDDIVSLLFYHPAAIRNFFGDGHDFGITMQYMQAEADFGTAGSVRNAAEKLGDGRVLIISGDVLTDFDLSAAMRYHEEKGADATLVLTRVPNPLQFGVVIVDDEGNITRFLEKPSWGEVFSDTINTGIYILEHHVLDLIPYKQDFDFSKNLFPLMMQEGLKLCGYIAEGYWRDVGTLNEYQEASMDFLAGKVGLDKPGIAQGSAVVGTEVQWQPANVIIGGTVVLGDRARVADTARLTNSVIGRDVDVAAGAVIQNSVIWDGCRIDENVHISDSVIGYETAVYTGATIAENVFISDRCTIGREAYLQPNIKLWPDKVVEDGATLSKSLVWEDKWLKELFTDARITGITNIEMTPEFGAKVGAALGAVVGQGRLVLSSRDPDNASRMLKRAITCGLMSAGVSIVDMQTSSIPMVRQELRNGRCAAGFHVRKSPFDKRSMDVIFFDGSGKDLATARTKAIERQFFSEDFTRADYSSIGSISFPERTTETYRSRIFATLDRQVIKSRAFNAVVDYSYGIASTVFPNILGDIGTQVVSLNAYIDPDKLTRSTEEFQAACEHISGIVRSLSYDTGFLIDAGAEKIFVADEAGRFLPDDRLLAIVAKLVLEAARRSGTPVKKFGCPVTGTGVMDLLAAEYGAELVRTQTTHLGMMNAVIDDPELAFVGGTRGGFIFPQFSFATDAMYSIVKLLELMAATGWKLGDVNAQLEVLHTAQKDVHCDWDAKGRVMRYAMRDSEQQQRVLIDGIKIVFDVRNWVLLLPSKETTLFHIYVEAESPERARAIAEEYESKVVQWRDNA